MLRERNNNNNKQNDQFLLDIIGDNIRWKSNDSIFFTTQSNWSFYICYLIIELENFVSIFSLSFFPFFPPPSRTISIAFKKFPSPKNTKFPPGDYDSRNNDGSGGKLGLTEKFLRQIVSTVLIVQLWIKTLPVITWKLEMYRYQRSFSCIRTNIFVPPSFVKPNI